MTKQMTKPAARGGRPTKKEAQRLDAEILKVARDLFIDQGFSATTMEQVVAGCGIGKDTLYRRYCTKEELFVAVAEAAAERTLQWFEEVVACSPEDPLGQVRHLARWFLDANLDPELLALKREAFIEAMRARPLVKDDPFTPKLIQAISIAHEAGVLCAPDPEFLTEQLIAAVVLGPSNSALMGQMTFVDTDARQAWFERAWDLFVIGAGR